MPRSVSNFSRSAAIGAVLGSAALALVLAGAMVTFAPQQASATPQATQATKQPCGACHANPAGGGKLTKRGEEYKQTRK